MYNVLPETPVPQSVLVLPTDVASLATSNDGINELQLFVSKVAGKYNGQPVFPEDPEFSFLAQLVNTMPDADAHKGPGVSAITPYTEKLILHKRDMTRERVEPIELARLRLEQQAKEAKKPHKRTKSVRVYWETTLPLRKAFLASHGPECEICHNPNTYLPPHIDHENPDFHGLVEQFEKLHGEIKYVETKATREMYKRIHKGYVPDNAPPVDDTAANDPERRKKINLWLAFHRQHANMRVVCMNCNAMRHSKIDQ